MSEHVASKLDFRRKLLLSAAGLVVFAVPFVFGLLSTAQTHAGSPVKDTNTFAYQAVSIKSNEASTTMVKSGKVVMQKMLLSPRGLTITNTPVRQIIQEAYEVQDDRVSGGPDWLNSQLYDVDAKIDSATADKLQKLNSDQRQFARRRMLQALLADQFKLTVHRETKELPVYALLIAENGPKLQEATPGDTYPNGVKGLGGAPAGAGMMGGSGLPDGGLTTLTGQAVTMDSLVQRLSWQVGHTVLDMTGLKGNYDFTLQWKPEFAQVTKATGNPPAIEPADPALLPAIQQQLGLKLERQNAPMEVLVIDHAERPSEN